MTTAPTAPAATTPDNSAGKAMLVDEAARSVKWSLLYNMVPRLITPFSTMILAALLTPEDFGLVAISTFVIALARIVVDLGLGKTVIQRQTHVEEAASLGLWVSLLISGVLYLGLWLAGPWLATAYSDANVAGVIRVSALALPLTAIATIPKALLMRNMQFRRLFWVNGSFLIIQSVASLILAIIGLGYWALILGQLFGLAISSLLAWVLARWRPIFMFRRDLLRSMLSFSVWVMVSAFQNWLFLYSDNAIAGLFLGVRGLGIYSLGFNIGILVPGFLGAAIADVAYPAFCKLQEVPREVGQSLTKLQALASVVLFPIALGISAVAPPAVALLYGDKWQGLGTVIALLVIMPGLSCIWALNENAYQAVGRPDIWPKLAGFTLLALLPLLWIAAPYGLLIFTIARFVAAWILPLGNVLFGARALDLRTREQLQGFVQPLVFAGIMYLVVSLMLRQLSPFVGLIGWVKLLSVVVTGALVYVLLLQLGDRRLWNQIRFSVRQILS
jgi:O-antigen/teichoic acid export membrane protein